MAKTEERTKAIQLRRQGFSYREILQDVPVVKSTLSLWLRSVGLSQRQKQRLTKKKFDAAMRGGARRREQRIEVTNKIKSIAIRDIRKISRKELWLMGVMLYWAEGTKERKGRGPRTEFTNSDPRMIRLFLKWLLEVVNIAPERIKFEIYIHENYRARLIPVKKYWADITKYPLRSFNTIYFKKNKIRTHRKNKGENYFGLIKIRVRQSAELNRRIAGWIEGITHQCRVI